MNEANNASINAALTALGYDGAAITYSALPSANIIPVATDAGATVDFPGVLNGLVYVGIHTGGGGRNGVGNQTTFYKISASDLDLFKLNPQGGSNAVLFATVGSAVPEPASWALMILGFGTVGYALRRRSVHGREQVA